MNTTVVSISFPKDLLEKIDEERGLVGRSKFVVHIITQHFEKEEGEKEKSAILRKAF